MKHTEATLVTLEGNQELGSWLSDRFKINPARFKIPAARFKLNSARFKAPKLSLKFNNRLKLKLPDNLSKMTFDSVGKELKIGGQKIVKAHEDVFKAIVTEPLKLATSVLTPQAQPVQENSGLPDFSSESEAIPASDPYGAAYVDPYGGQSFQSAPVYQPVAQPIAQPVTSSLAQAEQEPQTETYAFQPDLNIKKKKVNPAYIFVGLGVLATSVLVFSLDGKKK